jgi:hypothetical protein
MSAGSSEMLDPSAFRTATCGHGASAPGEFRINFYRRDPAVGADELGGNRGVITGAAAEMERTLARHHSELIEQSGPQARQTVVDAAPFTEGDQHVMVDMARISTLGRPIVVAGSKPPAGASNSPRSWPDKALARHRRKGLDDGARPDIGREPQFLGIPTPRLLDPINHAYPLSPVSCFAAKSPE